MADFDKDSQFLKSNAAAMRALAGGKDHQVTYAGTDTHVGNTDVRLPALPPTGDRGTARQPTRRG
jgi:cobaltochelatase CobT